MKREKRRAAGRELRCFFLIVAIVVIVTIGGNLRGRNGRNVKGGNYARD